MLGHLLDPEIGEIDRGRLVGRDLENGPAVGRSRGALAVGRLAEDRGDDRFRQALVVAMNVGGGLRLRPDAFRDVRDRSAGAKLLDEIVRLGRERLVDLFRAPLSLDLRLCFVEAAIVRRARSWRPRTRRSRCPWSAAAPRRGRRRRRRPRAKDRSCRAGSPARLPDPRPGRRRPGSSAPSARRPWPPRRATCPTTRASSILS